MRVKAAYQKWLIRAAILGMGMVLCLGIFAGAAFAQTITTDSSFESFDIFSPLVINMDANAASAPTEAFVEAEFADIGTGIDEQTGSIAVADAEVSECVKTKQDNKGHIKCKVKNLKHGEHEVKASVKDKAGNQSEKKGNLKVSDLVAPVIDNIEADAEKVTVYFHDPLPSSGIASISVTVDGQELHCYVCERHHNGMGPYLGDGHSDHGDGTGTGHYVDDNHLVIDNNVFPPPDDGSGSGTWTSDFSCSNLPGLSCGPHEVVVTITDNAGNTTTQSTVFQVGDCAPPETSDDAPAGWQNTDVTVSLTCTDSGSGCASTTYEVDGGATQTGNSVSLTTDGIHTITYRSTDNAGNVEDTKTATVMIDKTPPEITTSGNDTVEATGSDGAVVSYTAGASDATSGLASLNCTPASGSTFPIYPVGTTTVSCTAVDVAGNTSISTFDITVEDTTAPVVTYVDPVGTIYNNDPPTITGTALDAVGVASASVSIDGGTAISCTVDGLGNISCPTTTAPGYGWHTAVITATDAAGNAGTATGVFCNSSGRPNLTLYKVKGPYVVSGDPYRWVRVDYRMDNSGPDAYNVRMLSMLANNGIYLTNPLPLPLALGDIAPGGSVSFTVNYYWPVGVGSYKFTNTACAEDQCFTEYFYP